MASRFRACSDDDCEIGEAFLKLVAAHLVADRLGREFTELRLGQQHGEDVIADGHAGGRVIAELFIEGEAQRLKKPRDLGRSATGRLTKILEFMWNRQFVGLVLCPGGRSSPLEETTNQLSGKGQHAASFLKSFFPEPGAARIEATGAEPEAGGRAKDHPGLLSRYFSSSSAFISGRASNMPGGMRDAGSF